MLQENAAVYQREYLIRLPLPLAQLYARSFNAKEPRGEFDNAFYLFESLIKLTAAPLIADYLDEIQDTSQRDPGIDLLLENLALPSVSRWLEFVMTLSARVAARTDSASHPLGHLHDQLTRQRTDLVESLALYRRLQNGIEGEVSDATSVTLAKLMDNLLVVRPAVFGQASLELNQFYEDEAGPLLFAAANEILQDGILDCLGPRSSRLLHVSDVRRLNEDSFSIEAFDLTGTQAIRIDPIHATVTDADGIFPGRVYLQWPGSTRLLPLHPFVVWHDGGLTEELRFLSRERKSRGVELLSYTTGETERSRELDESLRRILSVVTASRITRENLQDMQNETRAATPKERHVVDEPASTNTRVGDFELLAELGRGGMGIVYLARQRSLGRTVALKMLPAHLGTDETARARFRREITALARCDHPSIVKILSSGEARSGQLYYAMEYVAGADLEQTWQELSETAADTSVSTLDSTVWSNALITASQRNRDEQWERVFAGSMGSSSNTHASNETLHDDDLTEEDSVAGSRPSLTLFQIPQVPKLVEHDDSIEAYQRRVAAIIRDAARALAIVHEQNIIHRDIKPSNLALTPDGKRVILMDFGLVKGDDLTSATTASSGFLGTLRYSAPEQLASSTLEVGAAADIRALGVTFWELLTRQRLFADAPDETQLAQAVFQRDVPRLRSIDRGFDADLEAIVARATERRVSDRIATAAELATHLDNWLSGRRISLRAPGRVERARRWVAGHRMATALLGSLLFAAIVSAYAWRESRQVDTMEAQQIIEFETPLGLDPVPVPSDNLLTRARVELGRQLFFDPRLSKSGKMSCASCHEPTHGYTVSKPFRNVIDGRTLHRNAQTVMNVSYQSQLFRDGRADRLESHALQPIVSPYEMEMESEEEIEKTLRAVPGYRQAFRVAFDSDIRAGDVARAIAAFERTLVAGNSPYDRFVAGDQAALSETAKRGHNVFRRARCHLCHRPPLFTDQQFHNVGVGFEKDERDRGRGAISGYDDEQFAFRTPSLRDVHLTPPYMHDGSLKTLESVVEYMNHGGTADPRKDPRIRPLKLTDEETADLVTFLREGLASGSYPIVEPPELPE